MSTMDYWFWYARNHNHESNLQSAYTGSRCDNIDSIKMSLEDIKALFATHCLDDTIIMPLVSLYFLMKVLLFLSHLMNGVTTIHFTLQENNNKLLVVSTIISILGELSRLTNTSPNVKKQWWKHLSQITALWNDLQISHINETIIFKHWKYIGKLRNVSYTYSQSGHIFTTNRDWVCACSISNNFLDLTNFVQNICVTNCKDFENVLEFDLFLFLEIYSLCQILQKWFFG